LFTTKIAESAIEGQAAVRDAGARQEAGEEAADEQAEDGSPRERTRARRAETIAPGEGPVEATSEASATL